MLIDTSDLPTIQKAEFDEETRTFSIILLCDVWQIDNLDRPFGWPTQCSTDLLEAARRVPAALRYPSDQVTS